jgi:ankyrin repeat protein
VKRTVVTHPSACDGHEAMMRLLLNKGADMNATARHGAAALYWSSRGDRRILRKQDLER